MRLGWSEEIAIGFAGLRRGEAGFAVPTVLLALVATFALASVTVIASVSSQQGTSRDNDSKAALAVAEAGVEDALLRYNRTAQNPVSNTDDCLPVGGTSAGATDGWCPEQISGTVDRGSFVYNVRPTTGAVEVVSSGSINGVTRRVRIEARSSGGIKPFGNASVIGLTGINLDANALIHADVATNGDITLGPQALLECGYAQIGVGREVEVGSSAVFDCPTPVQSSIALAPVNMGDVGPPTYNNANHHICNTDPVFGQSCSTAWNASTRRLHLSPAASITLGSAGGTNNYFFCQLRLDSNSSLYIAAGAKVRIYFGSPDYPPCQNQNEPVLLRSNSNISPTGAGPLDLALLVVGSDTKPTTVEFSSNTQLFSCDQSFVLYAPRSTLLMNSNSHFCGGLAAETVLLDSNADVTVTSLAENFELPNTVASHYVVDEFVECTATPATAPTYEAGC